MAIIVEIFVLLTKFSLQLTICVLNLKRRLCSQAPKCTKVFKWGGVYEFETDYLCGRGLKKLEVNVLVVSTINRENGILTWYYWLLAYNHFHHLPKKEFQPHFQQNCLSPWEIGDKGCCLIYCLLNFSFIYFNQLVCSVSFSLFFWFNLLSCHFLIFSKNNISLKITPQKSSLTATFSITFV